VLSVYGAGLHRIAFLAALRYNPLLLTAHPRDSRLPETRQPISARLELPIHFLRHTLSVSSPLSAFPAPSSPAALPSTSLLAAFQIPIRGSRLQVGTNTSNRSPLHCPGRFSYKGARPHGDQSRLEAFLLQTISATTSFPYRILSLCLGILISYHFLAPFVSSGIVSIPRTPHRPPALAPAPGLPQFRVPAARSVTARLYGSLILIPRARPTSLVVFFLYPSHRS
jgi:hypothetical protein